MPASESPSPMDEDRAGANPPVDPDSDELLDDEIAALVGGRSEEGIALIAPQQEGLIIGAPESL